MNGFVDVRGSGWRDPVIGLGRFASEVFIVLFWLSEIAFGVAGGW